VLLRHVRSPFALAIILLSPLGVFAQRHSGGVPSTPVTGSISRILVSPPAVNVTNVPLQHGSFAPTSLNTGPFYSAGVLQAAYNTPRGVFQPMAGAGDTDPDVRQNTPEDENLLRAFRPQAGGPSPSVYQPQADKDLVAVSTPDNASTATVVVRVPANAQVWFDGNLTRSTGPERSFETPALTAGKTYRYDIKARWLRDGQPVDLTRSVDIRPGGRNVVDFLSPNP
jgi:uncharacterized protein (TIGR03000 family)